MAVWWEGKCLNRWRPNTAADSLARFLRLPPCLPATASLKGKFMIKTITLKWLQSKGACKESLEAWHKETDHGTLATLNRFIECIIFLPPDVKKRELHNYTWCYVDKEDMIQRWERRY